MKSGRREEITKWFLASILYSKPIRESTATLTHQAFEQDGAVSPSKIIDEGWEAWFRSWTKDTRYGFSTAEKFLRVLGTLQKEYGEDLNHLHQMAGDSRDLEKRLMALGKESVRRQYRFS